MRKVFIGTMIMFCSFFMVSCGTNNSKTDIDSSKSTTSSNSSGGKVYFMTSSSEDNIQKANWVTGEANADAKEESKLKYSTTTTKNTTTKKTNINQTEKASTQNNTAVSNNNVTTKPNRTNTTPPVVQNNPSVTPVEYYPKDETANPNDIVADPYDDSNNSEEVDDKKVNDN